MKCSLQLISKVLVSDLMSRYICPIKGSVFHKMPPVMFLALWSNTIGYLHVFLLYACDNLFFTYEVCHIYTRMPLGGPLLCVGRGPHWPHYYVDIQFMIVYNI